MVIDDIVYKIMLDVDGGYITTEEALRRLYADIKDNKDEFIAEAYDVGFEEGYGNGYSAGHQDAEEQADMWNEAEYYG